MPIYQERETLRAAGLLPASSRSIMREVLFSSVHTGIRRDRCEIPHPPSLMNYVLASLTDQGIGNTTNIFTLFRCRDFQLIDNRPDRIRQQRISHDQIGRVALVGFRSLFEEVLIVRRVAAFDAAELALRDSDAVCGLFLSEPLLLTPLAQKGASAGL